VAEAVGVVAGVAEAVAGVEAPGEAEVGEQAAAEEQAPEEETEEGEAGEAVKGWERGRAAAEVSEPEAVAESAQRRAPRAEASADVPGSGC
jgi:hypothetical protein